MKSAANFIIVFTAVIAVLVIGKGILIPFIFALVFWFLTREIRNGIYKLPFAKKYMPKWLSNLIVFTIMIFGFSFVSDIITANISTISASYQKYEPNVTGTLEKLGSYLHIDILESLKSFVGKFDYSSYLTSIANGISGLLGDTFMIIIYALFIFLEESSFKEKFKKMFTHKNRFDSANIMISKIEASISSYLRLKTYVSLLTGILSYIVLVIVGVDSAFFWAFLIFLLNYILFETRCCNSTF